MGVGLGIIEANTSDELYGLMMDIMPGMLSGEGRTAQDPGCCPGPDDPQYNTLKNEVNFMDYFARFTEGAKNALGLAAEYAGLWATTMWEPSTFWQAYWKKAARPQRF